jgi:DNA-binding CsgD family transcriptional regulator
MSGITAGLATPARPPFARHCPYCGRISRLSRIGCSDCRGIPQTTLTPRQMQALVLAGTGLTTPLIARRMDISAQRVKNLLSEAYERLGLEPDPHRRSLLAALHAMGWIHLPADLARV